jgi:hypothetical protein
MSRFLHVHLEGQKGDGMGSWVLRTILSATTVGLLHVHIQAHQQNTAAPKPKLITVDEVQHLDQFDGQLIELTVTAQHLGSQRVFTIGEEKGQEVRVLIPNPSIDTSAAGNVVTIIGTVRRFDGKAFAQQYQWFKETDYKSLTPGSLVIVASSVRSPEGGELLPGNPVTKKASPTQP